ncbi:MAG: hypothetical protein VX320_02715 [Candidatus Thermoplasmatota archaeon]|nr:hypothetical protein [Candidatus Thermoplasmatota archaeon]
MATLGESWNQAAGATGVDQAGSSTGYYILALSILTLEIIWWVGIGFFIKRGFGIKRTEKAEDQLSP